jgi:predicted  nucleic acid-binding Zn-ribbon protein
MCATFPWLPRGWWADPAYVYQPSTLAPQDEIAALEESKNELGQEKDSIEQEINAIEKQVKELKAKLGSEANQPTGEQ